jgi:hypothetical protein
LLPFEPNAEQVGVMMNGTTIDYVIAGGPLHESRLLARGYQIMSLRKERLIKSILTQRHFSSLTVNQVQFSNAFIPSLNLFCKARKSLSGGPTKHDVVPFPLV